MHNVQKYIDCLPYKRKEIESLNNKTKNDFTIKSFCVLIFYSFLKPLKGKVF